MNKKHKSTLEKYIKILKVKVQKAKYKNNTAAELIRMSKWRYLIFPVNDIKAPDNCFSRRTKRLYNTCESKYIFLN